MFGVQGGFGRTGQEGRHPMKIEEQDRDGVTVLRVSGRLSDLKDTAEILQAVLCLSRNKLRRVMFVLTELLSVSRDGFRTLTHCHGHIVTNGGRAVLVGPPSKMQFILGQTGLRGSVSYYSTEDAAIASFVEQQGDA